MHDDRDAIPADLGPLLARLGDDLRQRIQTGALRDPLMVGIHSGGVWVAEKLQVELGLPDALGRLDISFYRDDFTRIGMNPQVRPSQLPVGIDGRHVILVDDVLFTGRTIRAALNELFDFGRPQRVLLVVLAERNGRELPIAADLCGLSLHIEPHEYIRVHGPDPLSLSIEASTTDQASHDESP